MRGRNVLFTVLILMVASAALDAGLWTRAVFAQGAIGPAKLEGRWTVRWLDAQGKEDRLSNQLILTEIQGQVSGTFIANDEETCTVSGTDQMRYVALTVTCRNHIWLDGRFNDENDVTGNYTAEGRANGQFKLERTSEVGM